MNPFATGASAGHAPHEGATESARRERAERIVGRIAKMWTKKKDSARRDTHARIRWRERKERERKRARGDRKVVRQNGPGLVIYIESYLHLNVFIFNARPRNGLSALSGFVSASHLCTPSHMLPSRSASSPPLKISSFTRYIRTTKERKHANVPRSTTQFHRCFPGGPYNLISSCIPPTFIHSLTQKICIEFSGRVL